MFVKKEIDFDGKPLIFETGHLAPQTNMAVKVTYGETVVLATAVSGGLNPDLDFFPLRVEYEEKLYASGSIKSSRFVKREGKPTDDAVVTRRLIDHAIRPLFPKDFMDEVQVTLTILSLDEDSDPEFTCMVAASVVLTASDIPWNGPMSSARVGYIDGNFAINPTKKEMKEKSVMDMMLSFVGTEKKFLAIEAGIQNLPEDIVLSGIEYARDRLDPMINLILDFSKEVNPNETKYEYTSRALDAEMLEKVKESASEKIGKLLDDGSSKEERTTARAEILEELYTKYEGVYKKSDMERALYEVQKKLMQNLILNEGKRPDGRALTEIRPLSSQAGILPRTHGSAIFERGQTQVLTVATLGNPSLELLVQDMYGERSKTYLHYYNFPPYSTGEVGRMGGPGGREIGHGMLAEKGLAPLIPDQSEFPYMIILMTEVLSSNGSTSMAAVCGSTLALMDAGVPIKDMAAGISVGLVADEENDKYVLLTDIVGLEDMSGHMDFKIAGTKDGLTAIQLDMKVNGIPMHLLPKIFEQSREARLKILDVMKKTLSEPRKDTSKYAPRMLTTKIDPEQIGMIIGSGGKTIREIQTKTGTELGIEEDGSVFISGPSNEAVQEAFAIIDGMTREVEIGEIFDGIVEEIVDFGAFVEILPGKTGLLHVSELAYDYVKSVGDILKVGDTVKVKVIDKGQNGKISLSKKALEPRPEGYQEEERPSRYDRGRGDRNRGGRDRGRDRGRNRR